MIKKTGDGVTLPKKEDTPAPKDLSEETPKDDASKGYKFLQNKNALPKKISEEIFIKYIF